MAYKLIDSKNKELYYYTPPLSEEREQIEARYSFWSQMNNIAMQNMMVQQRKMLA